MLNEGEAQEAFFSNIEIEVTRNCEEKTREILAAEETLSYAVFKCVEELSLLINCNLALSEVLESMPDNAEELTTQIGAEVADDSFWTEKRYSECVCQI